MAEPVEPIGHGALRPQLLATLTSGFCAGFCYGINMGWASPAARMVKKELNINDSQYSWVASVFPMGAALAQFVTAFLLDRVGRKYTFIVLAIGNVIAWGIVTLPYYPMTVLGRVLLGVTTGSNSIVYNTFAAEIAHKSIRGSLSIIFVLCLILGATYSFCFSYATNIYLFNSCCVIFPALTPGLIMLFCKESPVHCLNKGREEKARKVLQYYRGPDYNIEFDFKHLKQLSESKYTLKDYFKYKPFVRAFFMLLGQHIIQQGSGINALMYYMHSILRITDNLFSIEITALYLSGVQFTVTVSLFLIIDKIKRKTLWYFSLTTCSIACVMLGLYCTFLRVDPEKVDQLRWFPTVALTIYLLGFNTGPGPLPWISIGELFNSQMKAKGCTTIVFFNWITAFLVTLLTPALYRRFGLDVVLYGFAIFIFLGLIFIICVTIETKNKSFVEIQEMLGATTASDIVT